MPFAAPFTEKDFLVGPLTPQGFFDPTKPAAAQPFRSQLAIFNQRAAAQGRPPFQPAPIRTQLDRMAQQHAVSVGAAPPGGGLLDLDARAFILVAGGLLLAYLVVR